MKTEKKPFVVVDLGGTLAHRGERAKQDYMERFHEDSVDETVRDLVNLLRHSGNTIIILTGQREKAREITVNWLNEKGVDFDILLMKEDEDPSDTVDFKEKVYMEQLSELNIKFVLEDREDAVEMWRKHKVRCFQVASGADREYYKQLAIEREKEQISKNKKEKVK